jgi:hypothetical protein
MPDLVKRMLDSVNQSVKTFRRLPAISRENTLLFDAGPCDVLGFGEANPFEEVL